jgi:proteasome lid subunit RPN8/RPN11
VGCADRGLILAASQLSALVERAELAGAEECCGVLIGRPLAAGGCRVTRTVAAENAWPGDRTRRYEIPPQVLLQAMKSARREGLEVVGYYHSHPRGEPRPSAFDRERAWPEVSYLIVAPGARPAVRSWRLAGDEGFSEEPVVVEDAGARELQ